MYIFGNTHTLIDAINHSYSNYIVVLLVYKCTVYKIIMGSI